MKPKRRWQELLGSFVLFTHDFGLVPLFEQIALRAPL